jgi:hypothetical protein
MNVPLGTNRLISQTTRREYDDAKQQVPLEEYGAVSFQSDIHGNGINGIGPAAGCIAEAGANRIQSPQFRTRSKDFLAIFESQGIGSYGNVESRFKFHGFVLTNAFIVAEFAP